MLSEFTYKTLRFPFSGKTQELFFEKHKLNKKYERRK